MDGDSRGGAALSVKAVSGKPIKFVGTGEALEALEPFYPDRTASRILGAARSHASVCPLSHNQGRASATLCRTRCTKYQKKKKPQSRAESFDMLRRRSHPPPKCCPWNFPALTSRQGALGMEGDDAYLHRCN